MSRNFLLIVEGQETEKTILKAVLEKCDVDVFRCERINLQTKLEDIFVNIYDTTERDKVFLVQGPRNRIRDWLKLLKRNEEDFELFFNEIDGHFAGVFIIYDVDHTSKEELEEMFEKYNDETDRGLLLLSSPCVEVIADKGRTDDLKCNRLREYKAQLNVRFNKLGFDSAEKYIMANFNELVLSYIKKNTEESGLKNVMEHPRFVLSKINELNDRINISEDEQYVYYRYFTTVIYVCIAYIKGLVKEIDNVEQVKSFFCNNQSLNY